MKYIAFIILVLLSCEPSHKQDQPLLVIIKQEKAKNIHPLQYLLTLPEKAENIVILKEYPIYGVYRKALKEKFCQWTDFEPYLHIDIEDNQLLVPIIRPYCGEDLKLKDRNILKVYRVEDIATYQKHLLNNDVDKRMSETPQEAFILIYLPDDSSIESLQAILISIVKEYANIIESQSQLTYKKSIKDCSDKELRSLLKEIPFRVGTRSEPEGGIL